MGKQLRIDPQGRIILPAHIRHRMDLEPGHEVTVELESDGSVSIRPLKARCAICGENPGNLLEVSAGAVKKHVCGNCAKQIVSKAKEASV